MTTTAPAEAAASAPPQPDLLFHPPQERAFYKSIKQGATREDAALTAGITLADLSQALAMGQAGTEPYDAFLANTQTCEAQYRSRMTSIISKAANGDDSREMRPNWKPAAFLLERRFPELFGPASEEKTAARVTEATNNLVAIFGDVLVRFVPEEARDAAIRELQNAIARGSSAA